MYFKFELSLFLGPQSLLTFIYLKTKETGKKNLLSVVPPNLYRSVLRSSAEGVVVILTLCLDTEKKSRMNSIRNRFRQS